MSLNLSPVITNAGMAAAVNAQSQGIDLKITHMAFGEGAYTPTIARTGLAAEKGRLPIASCQKIGLHQLHLTVNDQSLDSYWVREVGFYTATGVLFAVWSAPDAPLAYKTAGVSLIYSFDLVISGMPDNVKIEVTANWPLPIATADIRGIIHTAPKNSYPVASDTSAVTPAALADRYPQRIFMSRYVSDATKVIGIHSARAADGGLPANAAKAFSYSYASRFANLETTLILSWMSNVTLIHKDSSAGLFASALVIDGIRETNITYAGVGNLKFDAIKYSATGAEFSSIHSMSAVAHHIKPAGLSMVQIDQRGFMTSDYDVAKNDYASIDSMELIIWEIANAGL